MVGEKGLVIVKTCSKCELLVEGTSRFCTRCGAPLQTTVSTGEEAMLGTVVEGKYRLDSVLAVGAMGTIFQATQLALGKPVAIKVIDHQRLGDPSLRYRFEREAYAASRLDHRNCIRVFDHGVSTSGRLYMVMEYIDGLDLSDVIYEEFPLNPERIARVVSQVAMALDEAHANDIIHRDLKPENIMLFQRRHEQDCVKVLDFGIAKLMKPTEDAPNNYQTGAGVVCGTPEYMSPEQARGGVLDGRSDLYSLGVVLYQMLTERLPFDGETPLAIVTRHATEPPCPPSEYLPEIHPALEALTLRLLSKDPARRPATAMEVVEECERIGALLSTPATASVDKRQKSANISRPLAEVEVFHRSGRSVAQDPGYSPGAFLRHPPRKGRLMLRMGVLLNVLAVLIWSAWMTADTYSYSERSDDKSVQNLPHVAPKEAGLFPTFAVSDGATPASHPSLGVSRSSGR